MDNDRYRFRIRFRPTDKEASDKVQKLCAMVPSAKLVKFGISEINTIDATFYVAGNDFIVFGNAVDETSHIFCETRKLNTDPNGDE